MPKKPVEVGTSSIPFRDGNHAGSFGEKNYIIKEADIVYFRFNV